MSYAILIDLHIKVVIEERQALPVDIKQPQTLLRRDVELSTKSGASASVESVDISI